MSKRNIILVGPPNVGKTTLFNALTGRRVKAVNYPGSTIELNMGVYSDNSDISIIDTPGLYSLKPKSDDEYITVAALESIKEITQSQSDKPDLIISLIDIKQASRHLIHSIQMIQQGYPLIIVVNKLHKDIHIDQMINLKNLEMELKVPILAIDALNKTELSSLKRLIKSYNYISYDVNQLHQNSISTQFKSIEGMLQKAGYSESFDKSFDMDRIFLNPIFGPLVFIGVMGLFFYSIFSLAGPFMDMIDSTFAFINDTLKHWLPKSWLTHLLTDGIISGLAAVIIFIPQLALLFFGIGLLESSGYLARGAVLIDKPLSWIGLNGRCFVPLLSGYACAIPAMLSTRNIQQEKIKKICCFIIPLMQCSARLPVYGLLSVLLFGNNALKSSLLLTGIYVFSLVLGGLTAILINPFIKGKTTSQFNIELPEWRVPSLKNIWLQMIQQITSFIKGAGPIIVMIAITLWAISGFPSEEHSLAMMLGKWIEPLFLPMGVDWRVGVAILLSFAAREVFVSALVIMFSLASNETQFASLLSQATFAGTDQLIFTNASIAGLIFFFMVAMQCGATLAIAKKEMKSTRFALTQLGVYIGVAYFGAILINFIFS